MDLEKFKDLIEINERKKAITERHSYFSKMRDIMTGSQFNIVHAVEDIANFLSCRDNDFKIIFKDYFIEMIRHEDEDFIKQYESIEKEIEEA